MKKNIKAQALNLGAQYLQVKEMRRNQKRMISKAEGKSEVYWDPKSLVKKMFPRERNNQPRVPNVSDMSNRMRPEK